ncbi:MAG: hypothetical protein OXG82_00295 [Gammaproteobacteria bacterium]|nr:hypothetical protein [Gammaproteobacteria bacterium]
MTNEELTTAFLVAKAAQDGRLGNGDGDAFLKYLADRGAAITLKEAVWEGEASAILTFGLKTTKPAAELDRHVFPGQGAFRVAVPFESTSPEAHAVEAAWRESLSRLAQCLNRLSWAAQEERSAYRP